jgi:hypothetical protein
MKSCAARKPLVGEPYIVTDSPAPIVLLSVPTEVEASLIVSALEEQGVRARAVGFSTLQFEAAAPVMIDIFVESRNLEQARTIINEVCQQHGIDWSQVDVGVPEPETNSPDQEIAGDTPGWEVESRPELTPRTLRGRNIFLALLAAEVVTHIVFRLLSPVSSIGWFAVSVLISGLYFALWYGCWRGHRVAVRLLVALNALALIGLALPPYLVYDFRLVIGNVLSGMVVITFLFPPSVRDFLR